MDLLKDILSEILLKEEIHVVFPNLKLCPADIIEMKCYQALQEIKAILENDSFDDIECFMKIEKIICVLEEIGSNGGNRHDFS